MEEKTLRALELDKILKKLAAEAACASTKERCLALRPATDIYEAERLLAETTEAERLILKKGSPPISPIASAKGAAMRAAAGGVLSMGELLLTARISGSSRRFSARYSATTKWPTMPRPSLRG